MENQDMLKQILAELKGIKDEQGTMHEEQISMRDELTNVGKNQATFREEQISMREDLTSMRQEQISMRDELTNVSKNQATFREEQISMREDLTGMNAQLEENTQLVKAIRDRQEETDAKLEALAMDVHQVIGDVQSLKVSEDNHQKVLEMLSMRSFEHESDIRNLKRA